MLFSVFSGCFGGWAPNRKMTKPERSTTVLFSSPSLTAQPCVAALLLAGAVCAPRRKRRSEGQGMARRRRCSAAAGAWECLETLWHCGVLLPCTEVGFDPSFLHGASGVFGSKPQVCICLFPVRSIVCILE